jgi:deoxyhypusine synthase
MAKRSSLHDQKQRKRTALPVRALSDGHHHNLEPVTPLDLRAVRTTNDMLTAMRSASFGARDVGKAADVLYEMVNDPECFVVCTLSGAMTVAKMGLVLCEMIDRGMVDCVVSTGALMTHGLVEAGGLTHFKVDPKVSDEELFSMGYDRVYDTLELERNLLHVEEFLYSVLDRHDPDKPLSSWRICQMLGRELCRKVTGRAALKSAYRREVPVFIPAFSDCELGLDFAVYNRKRVEEKKEPLFFDAFDDLEAYTDLIEKQTKLGIFTIGGGVPRNWAQQVGPYLDLIQQRLKNNGGGFKPFTYGVRICPDPAHWGHLSGCTYSEGVSWGKFVPEKRGGRYAEVLADATIVWPLVVKAVLERIAQAKRRPAGVRAAK